MTYRGVFVLSTPGAQFTPPKGPREAQWATSVGPEVKNFSVVYHLGLLIRAAQVVKCAADFQDHSCEYKLSGIGQKQ